MSELAEQCFLIDPIIKGHNLAMARVRLSLFDQLAKPDPDGPTLAATVTHEDLI